MTLMAHFFSCVLRLAHEDFRVKYCTWISILLKEQKKQYSASKQVYLMTVFPLPCFPRLYQQPLRLPEGPKSSLQRSKRGCSAFRLELQSCGGQPRGWKFPPNPKSQRAAASHGAEESDMVRYVFFIMFKQKNNIAANQTSVLFVSLRQVQQMRVPVVSSWGSWRFRHSKSFQRFRDDLASVLSLLKLWRKSIHQIGGIEKIVCLICSGNCSVIYLFFF